MDDILSVTPLGTEELPKHINQQFKDGATFYRSKTKFGVVADGTVRVYPCDLLVLQTKSGDRYIYDFVNVGTPTLAAKDALDSETLAQVNARMPTVGSGPTANSVSNSSTAGFALSTAGFAFPTAGFAFPDVKSSSVCFGSSACRLKSNVG